jgi:hypothetical protein
MQNSIEITLEVIVGWFTGQQGRMRHTLGSVRSSEPWLLSRWFARLRIIRAWAY